MVLCFWHPGAPFLRQFGPTEDWFWVLNFKIQGEMGRREGGEGQRCEHGMIKEYGVTRKHTLISNDHWLTLYNSHGFPWVSTPPKSRCETVDKELLLAEVSLTHDQGMVPVLVELRQPSWANHLRLKGPCCLVGLRIIICETKTELTGWRHWEMGATSKSGLYGLGMSSSKSAVWVLWLLLLFLL